jgi:hypothetical protein
MLLFFVLCFLRRKTRNIRTENLRRHASRNTSGLLVAGFDDHGFRDATVTVFIKRKNSVDAAF